MSRLDLHHPENELLLRLLDGELSRRQARQVRRHVEACWQCRTELDELQKLVAECVRHRTRVADALAPPQAWPDLTREFNRVDEAGARASLLGRSAVRWILVGAGAASLVAATLAFRVIGYRTGPAPAQRIQTRPAPRPLLPEQPSPASTDTRADAVVPSAPARAPEPEKVAPQPASAGDELRAMVILHQLGTDLGEPVEVTREGSHVVVGGNGVAPGRQRQIREALAAEPKVVLRFSEPVAAPPAPPLDAPPAKPATESAPSPLEAQIGGRAQLEKFSSQLLDHDEAAMTRVYALRRLAEQFPPEAERQLTREEQAQLKDLGRQHVVALSLEMTAINRLTFPLLGALEGNATLAPSWQAAAQALFVSARQVETLLPAWLGVTAPDRNTAQSAADVARQLAAALTRFRVDVQQCEELLKP